jgi:hypothetical protein
VTPQRVLRNEWWLDRASWAFIVLTIVFTITVGVAVQGYREASRLSREASTLAEENAKRIAEIQGLRRERLQEVRRSNYRLCSEIENLKRGVREGLEEGRARIERIRDELAPGLYRESVASYDSQKRRYAPKKCPPNAIGVK